MTSKETVIDTTPPQAQNIGYIDVSHEVNGEEFTVSVYSAGHRVARMYTGRRQGATAVLRHNGKYIGFLSLDTLRALVTLMENA